MAYGVTLPLLPSLVERFAVVGEADIARHTGWLTGIYTLGLFLFSPAWGALSDRVDRRWILVAGLLGSSASLWAMAVAGALPSLYLLRAIAGVTSAAVLPAVFACVVTGSSPERLQRRFAWIASATALGFLLGPVAGDVLVRWTAAATPPAQIALSPLGLAGIIGVVAAAGVLALPASQVVAPSRGRPPSDEGRIRRSLAVTAIVVLAITVAEVGLTLIARAARIGDLLPVAFYFALCSGVMITVQFLALPRLERRLGERRLVQAALGVLAVGVGLLAATLASWVVGLSFALAATGIGILIPSLAVRISTAAGRRQGWAMGRQAAAANLGQAIGAAATGSLFATARPLPFLIAVALLAAAMGLAWTGHPAAALNSLRRR
ncbi:MAG: MFS transporter [Burkholderiaceae bacterium]|nr:MFS transporter [Burkholderiaceae bacterium]